MFGGFEVRFKGCDQPEACASAAATVSAPNSASNQPPLGQQRQTFRIDAPRRVYSTAGRRLLRGLLALGHDVGT